MAKTRAVPVTALGLLIFALAAAGCGGDARNSAPPKLEPIKAEAGEAPPPALVKKEESPNVKVRRGKDGNYTWEITGRDVKNIVETDRELRKKLGAGPASKTGKADREPPEESN